MARSYAYALRLRLFIEGVEIPIIAANIQSAPNSPTVAVLQVPPMDEGAKMYPRTVVHLFFLDVYQRVSTHIYNRAELLTRDSANPTIYEQSLMRSTRREGSEADSLHPEWGEANEVDLRSSRYKLLFAGEITGIQWVKGPLQRSLVLKCEDFSNYWDTAYQADSSGLFGGGGGTKAVMTGAGTGLLTDFLGSPGETVAQVVSAGQCSTYPKMKGLAAGIVRLVEAVGGSYYPPPTEDGSPVTRHRGQNTFFSLAELRLHMSQMVTALENDPTSSNLVGKQQYAQLINRRIGGMGGQVSIRDCINAMSTTIFHETYGQPSPCFIPGTPSNSVADIQRDFATAPATRPLVAYALDLLASTRGVLEFVERSNKEEIDPADKDAKAKRTKGIESTMRALDAAKKTALAGVQYCGVDHRLEVAKKLFTEISEHVGKIRGYLSKVLSGAIQISASVFKNLCDATIEKCKRIPKLTLYAKEVSRMYPHRLNQQILRPDIWFGAPPRCNVIFPEAYFQFTFERAFLKEPTRLLLKTHDSFYGEDFLFDQYYFAPQAGSVAGQTASLQGIVRNDILAHELFTGVLPVFEKMSDVAVLGNKSTAGTRGINKISYAQRAANFLYFKYRFAARKAMVSCMFHPYIACGFPGLILDRYVDVRRIAEQNEAKERLRNSPEAAKWGVGGLQGIDLHMLGTNFLANFTSVSHMVNQIGGEGRTEVTCTYPRQPDENVEFLGIDTANRTVKRRFGSDAVRYTDIAALSPPALYTMGPMSGRIINVTDVTNTYAAEGYRYTEKKRKLLQDLGMLMEPERRLPVFLGGRRKGAASRSIQVPIAIAIRGKDYGPQITELAGGADIPLVFAAYRVGEEIARYRLEEKQIPVEEYLRPGWFGDVWHTSRIGEAYNYFFKTGAITDVQQVADPDGESTGDRMDNAADALAGAMDAENRDDPRAQVPAILSLDQNASIQDAVDFLVATYSYIKMHGLDTEEFIKSYVWRPIATMVDMFGTSDLTLSSNGGKVLQGIEGFHSRAFGPYGNFFGIVPPDIKSIVNIHESSYTAIAGDTRLTKLIAVQAFSTALHFTRASIG